MNISCSKGSPIISVPRGLRFFGAGFFYLRLGGHDFFDLPSGWAGNIFYGKGGAGLFFATCFHKRCLKSLF